MPVYTGDYLRDTQHLSCSEHGIYFKLLMHCWDQRGPAPLDERKLQGIVNARSADEIEALRRVLREFFTAMEDGWYNRRMQLEVERAGTISAQRSEAGRKGYESRAKQLPNKSQANAEHVHLPPPPPLQPPPPPQEKPNPARKRADGPVDWPCPPRVEPSSWALWLEVRRVKKAPMTALALAAALKVIAQAGEHAQEVVAAAALSNWTGLHLPRHLASREDEDFDPVAAARRRHAGNVV